MTVGDLINQINSASAITQETPIAQLNSGKGVTFSTTAAPDLSITFAGGTSLAISFSNPTPQTVGALINSINTATGNNGAITAAINAAGTGLVLTGTQSFSVANSPAAQGLGLAGSSTGNTLSGATINTPLRAAINAAGTGIVLTSTQPFTVQSDGGGATAADLGLAGASTGNTLNGGNINPAVLNGQGLNLQLLQLVGQNVNRIADQSTPLSDLNGGGGRLVLGRGGQGPGDHSPATGP